MALSKQQKKKLKQADKRRARRPEPTVGFAKPMKVSRREQARITNTNASMLLQLETLLVEEAERDDQIDDSVIASALRSVVQETEPESDLAFELAQSIERWCHMEDNDEQTDLAMRVIYQSVRTHSDCGPSDYGYLIYASSFVKNAATQLRYA